MITSQSLVHDVVYDAGHYARRDAASDAYGAVHIRRWRDAGSK